jgi:hypothetical protein
MHYHGGEKCSDARDLSRSRWRRKTPGFDTESSAMTRARSYDIASKHLDQIFYECGRMVLICKVHSRAIPPSLQGIARHLRGEGHRWRGRRLKRILSIIATLPLSTIEDLCLIHLANPSQLALPAVPYIKVSPGWACLVCVDQYLTTSLELLERHLQTEHGTTRQNTASWESCNLQTLFQETKHRKYFKVSNGPIECQVPECQDLSAQTTSRSGGHHHHHQSPDEELDMIAMHEETAILVSSPWCYHPFAIVAMRHVVGFSLKHLDHLFRSDAFHLAAEPLFSTHHVDAEFGMEAVFPSCSEDPVFYYALICAMEGLHGHVGTNRRDTASLQDRTIRLIRERLSSTQLQDDALLIGAIMILRGSAYKLGDASTYDIHTSGLHSLLLQPLCRSLSQMARRAVFWQDVYAALFLGRSFQMQPPSIFASIDWLRSSPSGCTTSCAPSGFLRKRDVLPQVLLDCAADIRELQLAASMPCTVPAQERLHGLDSMQASIESRLMSCRPQSHVAEAVRLGVFLCCYCSWKEIWDDKYIPAMIVSRLISVIDLVTSIDDFVLSWDTNMDLCFWLLFVAGCSVSMSNEYSNAWRQQYERLLWKVRCAMESFPTLTKCNTIHGALQDFLYCHDWIFKRSTCKPWSRFEAWARETGM